MALMHYVVAKQCGASAPTIEPIELDQLKNRYYEPGLLAKVFGFNKEPLRPVSAFDHVDLYPDVQALSDGNGSDKLSMKLTSCGGGIGPVQVFVNDKQFIADARGPQPDPNAKETTLTVDLKGAPVIPGKHNEVRIVAWNAKGYVLRLRSCYLCNRPLHEKPVADHNYVCDHSWSPAARAARAAGSGSCCRPCFPEGLTMATFFGRPVGTLRR
jgi:hypothetical protein